MGLVGLVGPAGLVGLVGLRCQVWLLLGIFWLFNVIEKHFQMEIYDQDMHKICPRYAQDMPKIWPRYGQDMAYGQNVTRMWP